MTDVGRAGRRTWGLLGLFLASLVAALGTLWAFQRGASDFSVFLAAGRLVLDGRALEIYRESPDRFLYAPGFAWLMAPFAALPRGFALALWCFAKAAVIGSLLRAHPGRVGQASPEIGLAAWAVVLLARPALIDFQYGQVNLFIVGAAAWALRRHFSGGRAGAADFVAWFALAIAAVTKLFALPLLLVPLLAPTAKRRAELTGAASGALAVLLAPALAVGARLPELYLGWWRALLDKGLPLESHNQSFAAFLHHYFSGEVTHVISLGSTWVALGSPLLSPSTVSFLSMAWICFAVAAMAGWFLARERLSAALWSAGLIAILILPSHLVWKPYFVLAIPLAAQALRLARRFGDFAVLAALGLALNFSGFDFVGGAWSARLEAASIFLWAELALLALALYLNSQRTPAR